jgi:hypothetical protein
MMEYLLSGPAENALALLLYGLAAIAWIIAGIMGIVLALLALGLIALCAMALGEAVIRFTSWVWSCLKRN